jgi:uncharacterized protein YegL
MTEPIPLILSDEPVKMVAIKPGPPRAPSIAIVYATRDGDLEVIEGGKPMRWSDQVLTKYRRRYEVDIGDHHVAFPFADDPLPTHDDTYNFTASISVSFHVTDPAQVVGSRVPDAVPVVRGHLLTACRPITRQFAIHEAEEAEQAIHARFRHPVLLHGGITIFKVEARLTVDEKGRRHLQELEDARRKEEVRKAQHPGEVNEVARETEVRLLRQAADHRAQERERLMVGDRADDPYEMVKVYLERNPHDVAGAIKMRAELDQARREQQERDADRWQAMVAQAGEVGALQPSDLRPLIRSALDNLEGSAGAARPKASVDAPRQQPAPAALGWDAPLRTPVAESPAPIPPPANLVPVYLVLDESAAAGRWIDDLTDFVHHVRTGVTAEPGPAAAIRLAVLGFAEDVAVRVPLGPATAGPRATVLLNRGAADYRALYTALHAQLTGDAAELRSTHDSIRPPVVVLVSTATPAGDGWTAPYRRLTGGRRRPEMVSVGLPDADPAAVAGLASFPELAFRVESDGMPRLASFVCRYLLACGRAALAGTENPTPVVTAGMQAVDPPD